MTIISPNWAQHTHTPTPWAAVERHTLRRPCPGSAARVCAAERWGRAGWSACASDAWRSGSLLRSDPTGTGAAARSRQLCAHHHPRYPSQAPPCPATAPSGRRWPSAEVKGQLLMLHAALCRVWRRASPWLQCCFPAFLSRCRCCSRGWAASWSWRSLLMPEPRAESPASPCHKPHPHQGSQAGVKGQHQGLQVLQIRFTCTHIKHIFESKSMKVEYKVIYLNIMHIY